MNDKTLAEHIALAEHYMALGVETVSLYRSDGPLPWEYATTITEGGSHRLDICTSLNVKAIHPCGLTFLWYVEIESEGANGRGEYRIDVAELTRVLAALPPLPAMQLRAILAADAEKVEAKGREYLTYAQRQMGDAAVLRGLAVSA